MGRSVSLVCSGMCSVFSGLLYIYDIYVQVGCLLLGTVSVLGVVMALWEVGGLGERIETQ